MAVLRESRDHLVPAGIGADRHDLAPRHGNVIRVVLAEMEEIAQHLPLDRAEIAFRLLLGRILVHVLVMAVFVFVDSLFELRAQRAPALSGSEYAFESGHQSAVTFRVSRGGVRIGHGPLACSLS